MAPDVVERFVSGLDAALRAAGRPERASKEQAYLRSSLVHLGVSVPDIRRCSRAALAARPLDRGELLAVVRRLWASEVHELRMAVVELLDRRAGALEREDMRLLEQLARESGTWAILDGLAVNVVGRHVKRFPELGATLDRWATDEVFWVRRAAMLALLRGLRTGGGDFERFTRYADAMLDEKEFFIRKAIGWCLREAGRRSPGRVASWVLPRARRLSGVTLREAVKPLSAEDRARIARARERSSRPSGGD